MADRYRKGDKERVSLNCTIDARTKLRLIEIAGEFSMGHAVERLVDRHYRAIRRARKPAKVQQHFASP
jgi:hypothetical protein